ncbi:MAG TPA: methyl-accepting chemotaxis protein, partial [Desulfuromonadales bacterium]|nr:methyl-accepting chemotaxis protein [Desulfuromonadales bacterium]
QEIERIGGEMKVLALNAGIKAARISDGGAGLSVIAEAIQKLSANALQATTTVTTLLREITDSAQKLSSEEGADLEIQSIRINEFIEEIGRLLQSLQGLNEDIVSNLTGIGEEGRDLAEDIDLVASGVSIREQTTRVFGSILESIRELTSPEMSQPRPGEKTDAYGVLMERYTMRSEREVHRSVIGESTGLGHREDDDGEQGNEFGTNVELF